MDNKNDGEEWKDYTNSLKLYEKIQKIYQERVNKLKDDKDLDGNAIKIYYGDDTDNVQKKNTKEVISNSEKHNMSNYDIINYYNDESTLANKAMELSEYIMEAIDRIYDMFRLCKENVFLSFNGGKDAVVILHLYRCAYAKYINDICGDRKKPNIVYFKDKKNEFSEVYHFLNECAYMFDFNIIIIKGTWESGITPFIQKIHKKYETDILDQLKVPKLDTFLCYPMIAFINGSKYNDSSCEKSQILNISSRNFPPYLYLNPIFYWSYGAIWTFILYFKFNYCILYNHGYTSIGSVNDTVKNEFLKYNDCYLPAYFLKNWNYERYNRLSSKEKQNKYA